jgi:hypothetical protein
MDSSTCCRTVAAAACVGILQPHIATALVMEAAACCVVHAQPCQRCNGPTTATTAQRALECTSLPLHSWQSQWMLHSTLPLAWRVVAGTPATSVLPPCSCRTEGTPAPPALLAPGSWSRCSHSTADRQAAAPTGSEPPSAAGTGTPGTQQPQQQQCCC